MRFQRKTVPEDGLGYVYLCGIGSIVALSSVFMFFLAPQKGASGLSVALPRVIASEAAGPGSISITVAADGRLYLDSKSVTLAGLRDFFLSEKPGKRPAVLIKADRRSRLEYLADVWALARESGVPKIYILTDE